MFQMNGEMLNLIDGTVKRAVSETVIELKKQNLMINVKQTPYQKTETLLYNYNNFVAAIQDSENQIEEIKAMGLSKKSKSITSFAGDTGFIEVKSDMEKAEEKIEAIRLRIQTTKNFIKVIDDALDMLADDPYYDLIRLRYFEGCSREEIAEHFDCDVKTVTRNKNRLINLLQIRLFSNEVLQQIFLY